MYNNLFSCKDKVVLITGGAGLLGGEIARGLSAFGATVFAGDNSVPKDKAAAMKSEGITVVPFDIASEKSVEKAFDVILSAHARIDVVINCAYPRTADWGAVFEDVPFSSWKANCNSHLGGYFLCSRKAAEVMKKQQCGSIINFASIYGIVGPQFDIYDGSDMTMPAAYAAIKGGIITFTKYLSTYYGKYNVRANVISPGGIQSDQSAGFIRRYARKTPLRRMGTPRDIIGAAVYLASDASSYVTGANIVVDGGWTAW